MAKYRVDVGFSDGGECFCVGMDIDAFNDDDADEIAREKVLNRYPDSQWHFSNVAEA